MSKWTKERPTEPGYYWTRFDPQDDDPIIVSVESSRIGLIANECGCESLVPVDTMDYEWLGPIRPASPCTWTEDAEDGSYDTSCGNKHTFIDGTPAENGYRFCPYCGGALKECQ